jgi:hypothetical protein
MSPKVLIRQYGTLVDRNNQLIAEDVRRLKKELKICEIQSRKDETKIEQVEQLKDDLEKLSRAQVSDRPPWKDPSLFRATTSRCLEYPQAYHIS